MSKRKRYSPEYKHELVELVRQSKSSCRRRCRTSSGITSGAYAPIAPASFLSSFL